jgi:hypothetical protein
MRQGKETSLLTTNPLHRNLAHSLLSYQAFDGAPQSSLYGSDLSPDYISLGYELFRDRDSFAATFIPSDIFNAEAPVNQQLAGQLSIIHASSLFHLFDTATQKKLGCRVVALLRPQAGSLVSITSSLNGEGAD